MRIPIGIEGRLCLVNEVAATMIDDARIVEIEGEFRCLRRLDPKKAARLFERNGLPLCILLPNSLDLKIVGKAHNSRRRGFVSPMELHGIRNLCRFAGGLKSNCEAMIYDLQTAGFCLFFDFRTKPKAIF